MSLFGFMLLGFFPTDCDSATGNCSVNQSTVIDDDCTFNGYQLYGKIKFVESFPDVKIQVVNSFPDLKVKFVESFPDDCGQWQIVESFPDTKVQIVESFPDIKVQFVDSFPGIVN
jgi:hypothetical protein